MNARFRTHFPFFTQQAQWAYLDSAATTLKPQVLIDATVDFYASAGSVHRSQYDLPQTQAFERARDLAAARFHLSDRNALIWTSGTTAAINLVANGLAHQFGVGDEIVISVAEHHANFIPWQQLAERTGAKLIVLPLNEAAQIAPETLRQALSVRTKLVAFQLVSNVTGVRQPASELVEEVRAHSSAYVLLDIAQAVCCEAVDTQKIGADFYAFSAHKMYGPNGVGALMGKMASLNALRPSVFGGKMLQNITEQALTLAELPYRLEAGTPNIAGIIGFGAVLEWLNEWDFALLNQGLSALASATRKRLAAIENVQILGAQNSPTISFTLNGIHPADIASVLTESFVAVRHGEHCAKPYLRYLAQNGTVRLSLAHYNTAADTDQFFNALALAQALLA